MATWPSTLPLTVEINGYNITPSSQILRSDMEIGPPRARRITTQRDDKISFSMKLSTTQLSTFRTWFYDSSTGINGGVNWFTGLKIIVDGTLLSTYECRFVNEPTYTALSNKYFSMSSNIEVR